MIGASQTDCLVAAACAKQGWHDVGSAVRNILPRPTRNRSAQRNLPLRVEDVGGKAGWHGQAFRLTRGERWPSPSKKTRASVSACPCHPRGFGSRGTSTSLRSRYF